MWDYTDNVKTHFFQPEHVGQIDQPDMDATVGNITCGDALRLMVKLDDEGRIADAKFQTFGCASAIASSDVLIDLILGKTIDEAMALSNQDIAEKLGGLPDEKMHCSVMGMEALHKAVAQYRGEDTDHEETGQVICQCFGVTDKLIEQVVREHRLKTIEDVTHYTKAGGGCGACHGKIQEIIDRVLGKTPAAMPSKADRPMTNLERIRKVQEVIQHEIRPTLQADGGDIELIDVDGKTVKVAFRGHCAWCRVRDITKDSVIGEKLRELVDPDIVVEDVSDRLE